MIGEDTTELVLKGCNVHWIRSYQRVAEKANSCVSKGNRSRRAAVEAFHLITKHNMFATEKQHVLQLCNVLHDNGKLSLIQHLKLPLSEEQVAIISKYDWSDARNWVEWWTRTSHLQMLCKPFARMPLSTWNKAPRNTNDVERANSLAKDGDSKRKSLYCAMQSLAI